MTFRRPKLGNTTEGKAKQKSHRNKSLGGRYFYLIAAGQQPQLSVWSRKFFHCLASLQKRAQVDLIRSNRYPYEYGCRDPPNP